MKQGRAACIPITIRTGSGVALAATIRIMGDTVVLSEVEAITDSTDLTATISAIVTTAVV